MDDRIVRSRIQIPQLAPTDHTFRLSFTGRAMANDSKSSTFRQESLEQLSSPEQLDQLMQVVSAKSWIPLARLSILVGLALIWSVVACISITVTGQSLCSFYFPKPPSLHQLRLESVA